MTAVALTVHRATRTIGGNCIELSAPCGARLVLDVGRPLDAPRDAAGLWPATLDREAPADVLVSHSHQDHWGLLDEVPATWRLHGGAATEKLIRLMAGVSRQEVRHAFTPWRSGRASRIGPFRVTPFLTDHSAFDAYMLLIEVAGRRVLYSGDFRTHGRKGTLVRRFMERPPSNIDVLVMEGTNLGSDKPTLSESDLEEDFLQLFQETKGRVFVSWSAQNLDRTVTLYRAAKRTGRTLVVDLYTAEVLELLAGHGRLPQPGWDNLKVVITSAFQRLYRRKGRGDFVDRMAAVGIGAAALAREPGRWVVMTRRSLLRDFANRGVAPGPEDAWSWSMWRGYLEQGDGLALKAWFDARGVPARHLHTSGHASPQDLLAFAQAVGATALVPVHGVAWDDGQAGFPNVRRLSDGERFTF